jgi:hypothetical protein
MMHDATVKPGLEITMGGKDWVIPALTLKQVREIHPRLIALDLKNDPLSGEAIDVAIDLVHLGMSRNYPEITREEVGELVDMANFPKIAAYLLGRAELETLLFKVPPQPGQV